MPASDISRLSIAGQPKSDMASQMARDAANREITSRVNQGLLDRADQNAIRREWRDIYKLEYYKYYAMLMVSDQQSERIIYVPTENPSARKFFNKHAVAGFNRTNCFSHVHKGCITVGKFHYPIDSDVSLETQEAFLEVWPGPLDRDDESIKKKATNYLDTLWQHDSQRRIKYCNNDEQRRTIIKILTELMHRNGSIDASSITRLLLNPEQTDIHKDDGTKKLETLQKYLLLGKRSDAIKYAKSKRLWDHAQCLAFLDKYQPPNTGNYVKDGSRLKDDTIVQLNNDFITSLNHEILNTVYRSLLNRILISDPESLNIVKHPNVFNDAYQFALLSANDCEMEYDQTNEIFRLVNAIKKATIYPSVSDRHLISLGLTTIETNELNEDSSFRSHISFAQSDNYCSRTLVISNIDLLILNEIWEYSLNLARKTNDPDRYIYIMDLVPYKLVFASRLLDLGLYEMFHHYLISIKRALEKGRYLQDDARDQFYDWNAIELSVQYLSDIWDVFCMSHHSLPSTAASNSATGLAESSSDQINNATSEQMAFAAVPPKFDLYSPTEQQHSAMFHDYGPSSSYFGHNLQPTIQEEVADFNPEPDPLEQTVPDHTSQHPFTHHQERHETVRYDTSRQEGFRHDAPKHEGFRHDAPRYDGSRRETPVYEMTKYEVPKYETSRHEISRDEAPKLESFRDDVPIQEDYSRRSSQTNSIDRRFSQSNGQDSMIKSPPPPPPPPPQPQPPSTQGPTASASAGNSNDPQQAGIFANLAGSVRSLLPKSNSKQMILPDDSKKPFVFDEERNKWVDTSNPQGENELDFSEPPPIAPVKSPQSYSFAPKSTKTRYPKV